jgi:hypothetical protein
MPASPILKAEVQANRRVSTRPRLPRVAPTGVALEAERVQEGGFDHDSNEPPLVGGFV